MTTIFLVIAAVLVLAGYFLSNDHDTTRDDLTRLYTPSEDYFSGGTQTEDDK